MRLLHVVPSFYPAHLYGGPIVSLHRLACAQVAQGIDVRVLTSDANGPGAGQDDGRLSSLGGRWVTDYGVPTFYARATRLPRLPEDLSLEVAARLPALVRWADVVHVTALFSPTSVLALTAATALCRPVVLSPRGSLLPWALRGRRHKDVALRLLLPMLRRVACWHATSEEEAGSVRDLDLCSPQAVVEVVENGVDPIALADERAAAAGRGDRGAVLSALVAPQEGPVVTMLGRLDPVKGIDLALAALARLRRTHPAAVLVLAGPDRDGYGAALQKQADRLGVLAAVRFAGLVVDQAKAVLLAGSDLLWLCSRMESFGNVVVEALSAGTPVVAVQTTPWRYLEQARVGRWVSADAEAVAQGSADLLLEQADPSRRADLSRRCIAATARFAWPEIARRMTLLYQAARWG